MTIGLASAIGAAVTTTDAALQAQGSSAFVVATQGGGVWVRAVGGNFLTSVPVAGSTSLAAPLLAPGMTVTTPINCQSRVREQFNGVQVGADVARLNVGGDQTLHVGLTSGRIGTSALTNSSSTNLDFQVPFFGLYASLTDGDFFADAQIRGNFFLGSLTDNQNAIFGQKVNARGFTVSVNMGYQYKLAGDWFIEPSAGINWSRTFVDPVNLSTTTTFGQLPAFPSFPGLDFSNVRIASFDNLTGRASIRVGTTFPYGQYIFQPFATASVLHEFADPISSQVNTLDVAPGGGFFLQWGLFSTARIGTYGQFGLGVAEQTADSGWTSFVRSDHRVGSRLNGWSVAGGARYSFNPEVGVAREGRSAEPAAALPAPAPYNWSGFFVGASAPGALWGDTNWSSANIHAGGAAKYAGVLAGGGGGYNYQLGPLVIGGQVEWDWSNARGGNSFSCPGDFGGFDFPSRATFRRNLSLSSFGCEARVNSILTATGRLGYAWDRLLIYGQVGLAIINRGGVGIVLSPINGGDCCLCGIDLDTCRDPNTETFQDWAQEVIDRFSTYTEVSPSGRGAKLFFTHSAADLPTIERLFEGKSGRQFKSGGGKHCPAIEVYRTGRYFTVTDESVGPTDIIRQVSLADLEWLIRDAGPRFAHKERQKSEPGNDQSRSGKAFRKGAALKTAGHSYDAMRDALLANEDPEIAEWARTKGLANGERELHRVYDKAPGEGVSLDDFNAYMPAHSYIFAPSREMWPAASVNSRISPIPLLDKKGNLVLDKAGNQKTMPAAAWLDKNKSVEQMTWAPGKPMLIKGKLIADGGWIDRDGVSCFNLYRPPVEGPGDPTLAGPWIDHINRICPNDNGHIINWLAHRVQRPQEKINHALVLGGKQGIGKDTLLEPVKAAIGAWNFAEVSPQQMLGRFNGFLKSAVLRVSEARDLGDVDRFQFYDHMKAYTAAPPDVLRVDEKNLREHAILNCTGVIITTNHKTDGIYLPADDRRHYVTWSDLSKEDFDDEYWNILWNWYDREGNGHVAAYLRELDISEFDPKAPPPKTQAFWDIVDANRAPEDAELADVLDKMRNPDATTLIRIQNEAGDSSFGLWLKDRKYRRALPHRLEQCGYSPVRNDAAKDGLWKINDARQAVYAKSTLSMSERFAAARKLAEWRGQ